MHLVSSPSYYRVYLTVAKILVSPHLHELEHGTFVARFCDKLLSIGQMYCEYSLSGET